MADGLNTPRKPGTWCFSTLHTNDAIQAVSRILDAFPAANQPQVRQQLVAGARGRDRAAACPGVDGVMRWPAIRNHDREPTPVARLVRKGDDHQLRSQISVAAPTA